MRPSLSDKLTTVSPLGEFKGSMIYFISDIHLGSLVIKNPEEHQQRFVSLLRRMEKDADAIYLLGDVFDFWMEYYWPNGPHTAQFQPVLDTLRDISKHCDVHYFIGNHDLWMFGWLEKYTGVKMHYRPEVVTLYGKRCFLAHGDGLGSEEKLFLFLRAYFHHPVPQFFYRLLPPSLGDKFGYWWAASSRRKEMANPLGYLGEQKEELVRFAKQYDEESRNGQSDKQPVDMFVFGHRHLELSLMLQSRACVYILGDFFRQFTYGTLSPEGVFSLEQDGLDADLEAAENAENRAGVSIAFM